MDNEHSEQAMISPQLQNDPWKPASDTFTLKDVPSNPIYCFISSENYIDSLEQKLQRLKGKLAKELTSKEMIDSLGRVREDQMQSFMNADGCDRLMDFSVDIIDPSTAASIQRRLHPERQAVNPEELVSLLQDDAVSKAVTELYETGEICSDASVTSKTELEVSTN